VGAHKGGSGFLESIMKNGDVEKRRKALKRRDDVEYLKSAEFRDLMEMFHYSIPE